MDTFSRLHFSGLLLLRLLVVVAPGENMLICYEYSNYGLK